MKKLKEIIKTGLIDMGMMPYVLGDTKSSNCHT